MTYIYPAPVDEEKEDLSEYYRLVKMFEDLGLQKSNKLVFYYQKKILDFGENYKDPKRKEYVSKLKEMIKPYKKVFGKSFI